MRPARTPLAWLSLMHHKARLATSLAGIGFAVFLMFVEMGFLNGVYDSESRIVTTFNADLVMINRLKHAFLPTVPFSRQRLLQALADERVESAWPVYLNEYRSLWQNFQTGGSNPIATLAFDPAYPALLVPAIGAQLEALRMPDTALVDARSRDLFGALEPGVRGELSDRGLRLVGTFELGPSFRHDGLIVMSDQNFFRVFTDPQTGRPEPDRIEFGLLRLARGADADAVREALSERLGDEVVVLDKDGVAERIVEFWRTFQPIGTVFGLGAAIGFIIGVVVCYQILFTDISDNYKQFATLKAIGYPNASLARLVMHKAVLLAVCGFVPGVLASLAAYAYLESVTGIRMSLTGPRAAGVLALTVAMCVIAAGLAARKVLRSDPAELF